MPNQTEPASEFPRRVAALITYVHPFRMIDGKALDPWSASIEQVNRGTWDYVKLHEIAGGIDVGLPPPYHMLIGRDGALALPPIPKLRSDQQAVEFFNRCLAGLLLGGVYCEAIGLDNLEFGSIIDWKYIRSYGGRAASNRFHELIRRRMAPPIEAILLMEPRTLDFDVLAGAARAGFALLKMVPHLSPEFLLKGVSGIARRDWGIGLSNLWITIEQLTESLWQRDVISPAKSGVEPIAGREGQLKDTRTWTAANRQELLHLKGIIAEVVLRDLYVARKARNDLSHRGVHPSEASANSAYRATLALLQSVVGDVAIPLSKIDIADHSLSDPFKPRDDRNIDPKYWMEILKLPGESELEIEESARQRRDADGVILDTITSKAAPPNEDSTEKGLA
jgi:hypothetical protein